MTSVELLRLIARNLSLEISPSTIRWYSRKTLKWTVARTRFGPMILAANKVRRHEFPKMCIDTKDTFDNVIWTDKSSVQLVRHSQIMRVKIGKERILKPAPKHTVKVHVWDGILKRGATRICVFGQIRDGILCTQIL